MRELRMPIVALMTVIALAPAEWANDFGFGQVTSPVRSMECNYVTAERRLAPSEVKELLKSASSPGDHLKLAAHFGEEAAQEEAAANWHDQMADSSESGAPRNHHKYLATNARRAAEHAMKRAQEQARIAQAMLEQSRNRDPPRPMKTEKYSSELRFFTRGICQHREFILGRLEETGLESPAR